MPNNRRKFIGWSLIALGMNTGCHRKAIYSRRQKPEINGANLAPMSGDAPLITQFFTRASINAQGKIVQKNDTLKCFQERLDEDISLIMVAIPGGSFTMGAPNYEIKSSDAERPPQRREISPFFMAKTPITQSQYERITGSQPSHFRRDRSNHPVENITWREAANFCQVLSQLTQRQYRLPTEAEWEYACRAGTMTPFNFGPTLNAQLANYNAQQPYLETERATAESIPEQTTAVDEYLYANHFGLSDMHGNVWEWCQDEWRENYRSSPTSSTNQARTRRVIRGGSWAEPPQNCRSASRVWKWSDGRFNEVGFRVVCSIDA
ncbi:MAG: formylglycine-generating enzyme family protein [Cyanobacteria bacterium P01_C01_bin.120]